MNTKAFQNTRKSFQNTRKSFQNARNAFQNIKKACYNALGACQIMNELEIMQWAVKGIEAEIKNCNKRLHRALLVLQAHKKGVQNAKFDTQRAEKRIDDIRADIELLSRKKAFLVVQIEEKG